MSGVGLSVFHTRPPVSASLSAVRKTTRTVENGCQTKFSEGGACGLYVVRGTQTVYSNVKLTAERDADTGFSDVRYFREVFRKYYGMSPSEYRNSMRG